MGCALRRALFLFLTAAVCFSWEIPVFPLAFLGGVGLYHASAGILPEPVSIRNALFSAVGFLREYFSFRRYCSGKKEKFAKPSFFWYDEKENVQNSIQNQNFCRNRENLKGV